MQPASRRFFPRRPPLLGLALATLLACATALPAAEPADSPKVKPPVPLKRVAPVHPIELLKKFQNGRAVVECYVTETGAVTQVRTVGASEREFGQAAEDALRHWEFSPGEIAGRPAGVRVQIPFDFILTPEQIIETLLKRTVFQEIKELTIPARELPAWPRPVQFLLPKYPESFKGSGKYGKAVVSIIIDKEGKVMNPQIVKATYPEFMLPSLITAARLEFPPQIMANNQHIYVSMDIQFDFKADAGKDKPPAKEKPKKS